MNIVLIANNLEAEALYKMFRTAMEECVNLARGSVWDDARERTQFLDQISMMSVKLIRADGEIVGFIDFRTNEVSNNLHTMVVLPTWQSKGVGSSVLAQLMASSAKITLSVLKTNPRARSLYMRKGFLEVSSTHHHHHMVWESNKGLKNDAEKPRIVG